MDQATATHTGDKRTGDDDQIVMRHGTIPTAVQKIAVTVTSHDGQPREQNFGQVSNAFIRIVNDETGREMAVAGRSAEE